jgi:hypothetical protein
MQELSMQRLLAREVPLRLAQVLQSCMDLLHFESETKVVWDLRRRYGPVVCIVRGIHAPRTQILHQLICVLTMSR